MDSLRDPLKHPRGQRGQARLKGVPVPKRAFQDLCMFSVCGLCVCVCARVCVRVCMCNK